MFSSSKKAARADRPGRGMPSIISSELRIIGDLVCQGDLTIEGLVEGNIKCVSVTIGESATIAGEIECETARICGRVKGQINGRAVTLTPTARVIGDIRHETIAIESGAYFEGQLRHREARDTKPVEEPLTLTEAPPPAKPEAEIRPLAVVATAAPKPPREAKGERIAARAADTAALPNGKAGAAH
jgi:cytoskeletal protein CcmA (bactofilin family)